MNNNYQKLYIFNLFFPIFFFFCLSSIVHVTYNYFSLLSYSYFTSTQLQKSTYFRELCMKVNECMLWEGEKS